MIKFHNILNYYKCIIINLKTKEENEEDDKL